MRKCEKVPSDDDEDDDDEIPSETETEKELMDDFFEKISLNDHSPLEIDKICLHADNIKVMSPTKITKVSFFSILSKAIYRLSKESLSNQILISFNWNMLGDLSGSSHRPSSYFDNRTKLQFSGK